MSQSGKPFWQSTKGWVIAIIVLVYFIVVHVIEGDVVGPRIVGKTIGLHPVVAIAALIAGVLQALLIAIWIEWRATHPKDFQRAKDDIAEKAEETAVETQSGPEPPAPLLS